MDRESCYPQLKELISEDILRYIEIDDFKVAGISKFDDYEQVIR